MTLRELIEGIVALIKRAWAIVLVLVEEAIELVKKAIDFVLDIPLTTFGLIGAVFVGLGGLSMMVAGLQDYRAPVTDLAEEDKIRKEALTTMKVGGVMVLLAGAFWYVCS